MNLMHELRYVRNIFASFLSRRCISRRDRSISNSKMYRMMHTFILIVYVLRLGLRLRLRLR